MIAARRGQLVVAKCLLAHSADPIVCDYEALEAVDYCKRGDYRMKRLISRFSSQYHIHVVLYILIYIILIYTNIYYTNIY